MQIIANFSYAGTGKYVSHAVVDNRTLCGMSVTVLFARKGQEWDYVEEEEYLGITHKHKARDVGCLKCSRLLTLREADGAVCVCSEFVPSAFDPSRCAVCRKTRPAANASR